MPRNKASADVAIDRLDRHACTRPYFEDGLMRSVLSVVLEINRLCIRSTPPFTMSENRDRGSGIRNVQSSEPILLLVFRRTVARVLIPG